ncbi:DUF5018-related domain-containing protein [Pseudalgibacter alginicilyticus]|nr:hypothetical protein [Pseudalgibacter alginicilyticus]
MKNIKNILFFLLTIVMFSSCEPRVELDRGQWGNNSDLINVLLYVYEFDEHELQEFYDTGELTPSVRKVQRGTGVNIDDINHTASIDLPAAYSLVDDVVVIAVQHHGTLVEPLNGAPTMGLPADLTGGSYTYRIHSADGNYTDWVITVNQL